LLTPNGRFELDKRICLSISSYHPENWHPTWGIATVLHALREFMATPGNNAIGAIEYPKAVREELAMKSVGFHCSVCGCHVEAAKEKMVSAPRAADNGKDAILATPVVGPSTPLQQQPVTAGDDPNVMAEPIELPAAAAAPQAPTEAGQPTEEVAPSPQVKEELVEGEEPLRAERELPHPTTEEAREAAARAAPELPRRRPALVERHNGEVVFNISIHSIDRCIQLVLLLIVALLCKKACFDYWQTIGRVLLQ
jgi:hypothetical protein